jgi:hypothetical protein
LRILCWIASIKFRAQTDGSQMSGVERVESGDSNLLIAQALKAKPATVGTATS